MLYGGDIDDNNVIEVYLPTSSLPSTTPKPVFSASVLLESEGPSFSSSSISRQDVRNKAAHKFDVFEVSSPRVFSPAGYSPAIKSQSRSYGTRTRSKDVFFRYNCKETTEWETPKPNKWDINTNPFGIHSIKPSFKYMFQRTSDMSRTMDNAIWNLGSSILEYYNLDSDEDLRVFSAEDLIYVGRIRCDGKLSVGSTFFEGTGDGSNGQVVTLDLSQLEEYFLFPGQVLALSGKSNLGKCVIVSKVFLSRPLPFPDKPILIDRTTGPLRMLIAAGPYTTTDSLVYEPLTDFLDEIRKYKPHVCIMIGPFIDASHPLIETGQVTDTFDEMFYNQMSFLSEEVTKIDSTCKLLLVSSSKDVHHHVVYPTPAYSSLDEFKNIIALPDPSMISVAGVVIGITSTDTLKHLGGNELAFSTINTERMGRIARHLLSQQTFYPLYPPDESVPMDIIQSAENGRMGCTPHILILPSDLRYFIKDVDGTIVVNPERLTKGLSGGTFAKLQLDLPGEDTVDPGSPIADYVMGEIIKI